MRFIVIEKRAYKEAVLIDAVDEKAARCYDGDILDEVSTDSWGDELISCEEVSADTTEIGSL